MPTPPTHANPQSEDREKSGDVDKAEIEPPRLVVCEAHSAADAAGCTHPAAHSVLL